MNLVGNALLESGDYIRVHMGIDRTPQQIVDELLDGVVARVEVEVPWRPGARELLTDLHRQGVPCALVTMSWQRFVDPILARLRRRRLRDGRDRGPRRVRQAAPRALPHRGRRAGRPPGGVPGDRGLQHRRQVGRRCRVHRAVRAQPRADPRGGGAGLRRHPRRPRRRGSRRARGRVRRGVGEPDRDAVTAVALSRRTRRSSVRAGAGAASGSGGIVPPLVGQNAWNEHQSQSRPRARAPVAGLLGERGSPATPPRPCARWRGGRPRRARSAGPRRCRGRPAAAPRARRRAAARARARRTSSGTAPWPRSRSPGALPVL